jgi:hypothetical protein
MTMSFEIPDPITREYLNDLARYISVPQIQYLQDKVTGIKREGLRKTIAEQVEDASEIFDAMSEKQYYEQRIDLGQGLSIMCRTLASFCQDESYVFAREKTGNSENYGRVVAKRRLAYGVTSINGNAITKTPITGSYIDFQMMSKDESLESHMKQLADKAYRIIDTMPEVMINRVSEAYGMWESVVYERINGIDSLDETVKNSTGTP